MRKIFFTSVAVTVIGFPAWVFACAGIIALDVLCWIITGKFTILMSFSKMAVDAFLDDPDEPTPPQTPPSRY